MHPSEVYARQLLPRAKSYPLWLPEPPDNLCEEYKKEGVRIGDVGTITDDGEFDYIFNICEAVDHPINHRGVPDSFEQLTLGSTDIRKSSQYQRGSDVTSVEMEKRVIEAQLAIEDNPLVPLGAGAGFEVKTTSKTGAVCLLPDGATTYNLIRRTPFREYALKHAVNWYKFVNGDLGREVPNGALYLITGADKASSWAVASFSNILSRREISLKLTAFQIASGTVSCAWEWEQYSPAAVRSWPRRDHVVLSNGQNHATFIRGFKVAIRHNQFLRRIVGKVEVTELEKCKAQDMFRNSAEGNIPYAGYKRISRVDSSQKSPNDPSTQAHEADTQITVEDISPGTEPFHPSTVICNKLLDANPDLQVIAVHDDEWAELVASNSYLPTDEELMRQFHRAFELKVNPSNGHGLLSRRVTRRDPVGTELLTPFPKAISRPLLRHAPSTIKDAPSQALVSPVRFPSKDSPKLPRPPSFPYLSALPKERRERRLNDTLPSELFTKRTFTKVPVVSSPSLADQAISFPELNPKRGVTDGARRSGKAGDGANRRDALRDAPTRPYQRGRSSAELLSSPKFTSRRDISPEGLAVARRLRRYGDVAIASSQKDNLRGSDGSRPASPILPVARPRRSVEDVTGPVSGFRSGLTSSSKLNPISSRSVPSSQGDVTTQKTVTVLKDGKPTFHLMLGSVIGRGQFSSVYQAIDQNTGHLMVVKRAQLNSMNRDDMTRYKEHVDLIKALVHPNIVKYEGSVADVKTLDVVFEYVEGGNLAQMLCVFGTFNECLAGRFVAQILEGLRYIHDMNIVHCDLKASNILVTKAGDIKLSGFENSVHLVAPGGTKDIVAGTPNWMAPEVIELHGASQKSDIWSLACTIIEFVTGQPPYAEITNSMSVMFRIVQDPLPPLPLGCSKSLRDLLIHCFSKDVQQRPSAEVLASYQWLKESQVPRNLKVTPVSDTIPFLRRVSADLHKLDAALDIPKVDYKAIIRQEMNSQRTEDKSVSVPVANRNPSKPPTADSGPSSRKHQLIKTTVSTPIECSICEQSINKNVDLCTQCGLIMHPGCVSKALACDGYEEPSTPESNLRRLSRPRSAGSPLGTFGQSHRFSFGGASRHSDKRMKQALAIGDESKDCIIA